MWSTCCQNQFVLPAVYVDGKFTLHWVAVGAPWHMLVDISQLGAATAQPALGAPLLYAVAIENKPTNKSKVIFVIW